ncbi:APC family permease [Romboutsia lituseburensis]|uniref:Amino acid transporter n=1 Tax=Romboutsia lituseburensis DSM 797 TaxID=1121325 RepID=A0A1G9MGM4_9FIRM|nr:APC family permease [Romboutsia lituseburensis]SDL73420.1 Amino acid transporter [Romboutsia lituseburensis DSM 797]
MEEKNFDRVLGKKDVLALAFGAMIGWGWVILVGGWILKAGTLGAMSAFIIGGIMVIFVGLVYAELTAAMPECGGANVFSRRALGKNASFVCTWALILGYVGVVAFEACALPNVVEYLLPGFLKGYMYSVAGFDIYASWVAVGVVSSIIITAINYFGAKPAAVLQSVLTVAIAAVGIALICGSAFSGNIENTKPLFIDGIGGIMGVAIATPFMYVGFDVIPQAAEEINMPFNKIGKILILSIVMAVSWYALVIFSVSMTMKPWEMETSILVTADAMKFAFGGRQIAAQILIIAGLAGIVSSWNAFLMGGSRAIYSLAQAKMLPSFLAKLHPKYKTPTNAILLIGLCSCVAPFFGKVMLTCITNAGSFGIVIAYVLVSISFMVLRKKEPDMPRPYKLKNYKFIGSMAIILASLMLLLYIPGLIKAEWIIVGGWTVLGAIFFISAKRKSNNVN